MSKVAVVSGGSRGIGASICRTLAQQGYTVLINYRVNKEKAEALASELKSLGFNAEPYQCDVRDESAVKELFSYTVGKYGKVDVLVNNAGVAHYGLVTDVSTEEWDIVFDTNIKGTFLMCREALRDMVSNKYGRIVNISSMWGVCGASCEAVYSASKAAVIGLTKALAQEVGPSGITVNCVAPGAVQTDMMKELSEDTVKMLEGETPLGRVGTPEDIAEAVAFLVSDKASFITGAVLNANGGMVI
ncbi:MAG: SDR family oxidoreductase [Firmicutes bacterium]|nr:SDR family oxidoreductase [Bacillota bacterium]